jgi:hypothetical protein
VAPVLRPKAGKPSNITCAMMSCHPHITHWPPPPPRWPLRPTPATIFTRRATRLRGCGGGPPSRLSGDLHTGNFDKILYAAAHLLVFLAPAPRCLLAQARRRGCRRRYYCMFSQRAGAMWKCCRSVVNSASDDNMEMRGNLLTCTPDWGIFSHPAVPPWYTATTPS